MRTDPSAIVACLAIVAVAAICDLLTRRIPNLLTLGGILLGLGLHTCLGAVGGGLGGALRGAGFAFLGAALCAVVPLASFVRGEMGGGDVKLFAAIGALAGPSVGFDAQVFTFLLVLVVLWPWRLVRTGRLRQLARQTWRRLRSRSAPPVETVTVARVVLGPTILIGLCVSVALHGGLP